MGYYDIMRRRVLLAGQRLTLITKPGVVPWDESEMAATLLAEDAEVNEGTRVLLLEGGAGALAVWAARRGALVDACDGSLVAGRMTAQTLAVNDVQGVTVHSVPVPPPELDGTFDVVLLPMPKGRAYTQLLIAAALRALKPGGRLYLAGPNAGGAKALVKDAGELFGRAATLRTKARCRVALAVRPADAALPPVPEPAPFEALGLTLFGLPGVFSRDGLDDGTAMLLSTIDAALCDGARVLDVGCGSGVIGFHALRQGAVSADLIDSDWAALDCAARGRTANGFDDSCRVWGSDLFADVPDEPYDLILSNPPFHTGHGVDTAVAEALIAGAKERLARRGRLRLVANRFLPYEGVMRRAFGTNNVSTVTEDTRYTILEARA
ncbi:MAG: class I SAM-dependent methyltransferase [Anaerolineae bacterium]|nr:class I SAM-dependent methyltransferase [Anaerolineae bacterium]